MYLISSLITSIRPIPYVPPLAKGVRGISTPNRKQIPLCPPFFKGGIQLPSHSEFLNELRRQDAREERERS